MEIRKIIINKSYGFKEYREAVKKHPDFDINGGVMNIETHELPAWE